MKIIKTLLLGMLVLASINTNAADLDPKFKDLITRMAADKDVSSFFQTSAKITIVKMMAESDGYVFTDEQHNQLEKLAEIKSGFKNKFIAKFPEFNNLNSDEKDYVVTKTMGVLSTLTAVFGCAPAPLAGFSVCACAGNKIFLNSWSRAIALTCVITAIGADITAEAITDGAATPVVIVSARLEAQICLNAERTNIVVSGALLATCYSAFVTEYIACLWAL